MSSPYVYWAWKNVLELNTIKEINKLIKSNYDLIENNEDKAFNENNIIKKNNETYLISYGKIKQRIFNLINNCYEVNKIYFGYDLWNIEDNTYCNYNVYKDLNKSDYGWHIDGSPFPYSDIKLTVLINLSEKEFEGGDFFLESTNLTEVKELKEIGSMIMFKSFTRHKVTPVTKGERKNLALFLNGPNFK